MGYDINEVINAWENSQEPTKNVKTKEIRRAPDADQKKIRRQMARSAAEETMTDIAPEREIADLMKAARLAPDLETAIELVDRAEELKRQKTAADNGKLDFSAMIIEDALTPGTTHELHTTATDWITGLSTTADLKEASQKMVVEASQWFSRAYNRDIESITYRDEFDEQVKNYGQRTASAFGDQADAAYEVFKTEANRLRTMAVRSGHVKESADGTPSYDPGQETDQDLDYAGRSEADSNIGELKSESAKGGSIDDHVTNYYNWAKENGHDGDSVEALKAYEKQPGISRAHTNAIADQQYIGGGDTDWRKNAGKHDQSKSYQDGFDDHYEGKPRKKGDSDYNQGRTDGDENQWDKALNGDHKGRHQAASTLPEVGQQGYPTDVFSNLAGDSSLPPEATSSNRAPVYRELASGTDVPADNAAETDAANQDANAHRDASFGDDHHSFPVNASRKEANMDQAQCPTCAGHGRVAVRGAQKVAYSNLPQIDQIANADDSPGATPYPAEVAFPWVLNPQGQVQQAISETESQISDRNSKSPLLNKGAAQRTAGNDDSGWIGDMGGRGNGYPGVQDGGNQPAGTNLGQPDPVYGYGGDNGNQPLKPYGAQEANDYTNQQGQNWQVGQPTQDDTGAREIGGTSTTAAWQQAAAQDPEIKRAQAFLQAKFAEFQANQGR